MISVKVLEKTVESMDVWSLSLCLFLPQGDYDPVKTRVLHLKMNPTTVAKQQRQQEVEALREEVTHLRELVRSLQGGGSLVHSQDNSSMHNPSLGLSLPPSKEVLGKIHNMDSHLQTHLY